VLPSLRGFGRGLQGGDCGLNKDMFRNVHAGSEEGRHREAQSIAEESTCDVGGVTKAIGLSAGSQTVPVHPSDDMGNAKVKRLRWSREVARRRGQVISVF
jgi:hypothetical protein